MKAILTFSLTVKFKVWQNPQTAPLNPFTLQTFAEKRRLKLVKLFLVNFPLFSQREPQMPHMLFTNYWIRSSSFRSSSRCRQNFNLSNLNQKWRSPLDFCLMLFFPFRVFRFFSFSQAFSRLYLSVKSFSRKLQELWKYFEGSKGGSGTKRIFLVEA